MNSTDRKELDGFCQRLRKNDPTLTSLNLSLRRIDDDGAKALAQSLQTNTTLTELDLWRNQIGDDGATALAQCLQTNTTLTELYLRSNQIGVNGAKALAQGLQMNTTLTELYLSVNQIGVNGAKALAQCLQTNTTLTKLDLKNNQIGDDGAKALAQGLQMNTTLTKLILWTNEIGDDGAKALAQCLQMNMTLIELDLSFNQIGVNGAKALAQGLQMNTTLQQLDLTNNQIGVDGAKALAQCLQMNTTLQRLYLVNNQIGDNGAKALAQCLQMNTTLILLDLTNNQIRVNGASAIALAFANSNNRSLGTVRLDCTCDDRSAANFVRAMVEQKFPNLAYIDFIQLNQYLGELRMPAEYADKDNWDILSFLRERWESGEEALSVTKIVVTGPGRVGKTCLVSRLVRNVDPTSPPPPMTNGMLEERIMDDDSGLELVFYDFGGQPIYATTHQLFLRTRAVFVVAWEDNRQTESPFDRYAKDVLDATPEALIIFVTTKADMGYAGLSPDEVGELEQAYGPNFAGYVHTSARDGRGSTDLVALIKSVAMLVMEAIGAAVGINDMLVPRTYMQLRANLKLLRENGKFFLTREEWESWADKAKIRGEDRVERALTLFHEVGEVLCLPTGEVILDPPKLAQILARVVTNDERYVKNARGGYLRHRELDAVWEGYPKELHRGFLDLIHECEIGFPIRGDDGDYKATLIPAMLCRSGLTLEEIQEDIEEEYEDDLATLKENPRIELELSTESRRLWPKLQSLLRGVTVIGGWGNNGSVVMETVSLGGRKKVRSYGSVAWIGTGRVLLVTTYGRGRLLQHRILQALSSCLKDFPGTTIVRLDMKCASRLATGRCHGGWDMETVQGCQHEAAICPECSEDWSVDKVADWLVAFKDQRQHTVEVIERSVQGAESRSNPTDSLHHLKLLFEKYASSPEILSYLLLAHQKHLLVEGLSALWLAYETEGSLHAYPLCPHLECKRIRVKRELEVNDIGETRMARSSPQQANQEAELSSIVKAIQKHLRLLPPRYQARFEGVVWAGHENRFEHNIRTKTEDNFVPVKIAEIGEVWVHKDDELYFTGRDVQVDAIKKLKRQVHGCIADDFTVFISHTGKDAMAAVFAAYLAKELKDEGIVFFYDETCLSTGDNLEQRIPAEAKGCTVFVAVMSPTYFQRYWCMLELDLALRHNRVVLPVYFDPLNGPGDLPKKRKFMKHLKKDKRVKSEDLDRWWRNVSDEMPVISGIRMRSLAGVKGNLVSLQSAVLEDIRRILQEKAAGSEEEK